jgi:hypothetical protein
VGRQKKCEKEDSLACTFLQVDANQRKVNGGPISEIDSVKVKKVVSLLIKAEGM